MANIVRMRVTIRGVRPILQNRFGEDAIPLEGRERTGVAGNDPEEWKRSRMVTDSGQLYILASQVFASIRDGSRHTKKGRSSIQPLVVATLQVEEEVILLNRTMPTEAELGRNPLDPVYLDVRGVVNKATKGRNVRYRLAASKGWECTFTLRWDKTVVSREQMRASVRDAGTLEGLGDGRKIGMGRWQATEIEELADAEEAAAA